MKQLVCLIISFYTITTISQNTVGIITNHEDSYNGYTLFAPNSSTETYLINNCGEVVHQWSSSYTPGASVYLLNNGNLLRTGKIANSSITFGGVGGHIEILDWDSTLIWQYTYSSSEFSQHHDIFPLPNGNILMLAVNTMSESEAIQSGRDPSLILDNKIFNEQILELEPIGNDQANIIWEWNFKDHLIQNHDNTKDNYGVISEHPELLDFNYLNNNNGNANWLHINSIQYNANLDQIILSSRLLSEVYIIDHSTTTAQAASHSGGTYGKGGDILYRWGNKEAYDMGDENDRTLYSQHYPHWIEDGLNDAGKIIVFNNGNSIRFSSANIFNPPTISPGEYAYDNVNGFGPESSDWIYTAPNPEDFFSSILSSAQRLPNGNTLICDGDSGYFFELNSSNNIVWEYINPDTTNGILSQGDDPSQNLVFRALKYNINHIAFSGRDLPPGNPIELNPDLSDCTLLSNPSFNQISYKLYPNPVNSYLNINTEKNITHIKITNLLGSITKEVKNSNTIDLSEIAQGLYIIQFEIEGIIYIEKIVKK